MWYITDIPIVASNHGLIICLFLVTGLSTLCVILRTFTRTVLAHGMRLEDWHIIAASFGLGNAVEMDVLPSFLQARLSTIAAYNFTQLAVKFSILFQCKRIFTSPSAQHLFICLLCWLSAYGLFCFFSCLITCWPIARYWDQTIPGGCINQAVLHYALASINILNDIAVLVAPWPFLRSLRISRKAKIVLIGVFGGGGFACAVAIARLYTLYSFQVAPTDRKPIVGVDLAIWSAVEINVAIICTSVPTFRLLFRRIFPNLGSSITMPSEPFTVLPSNPRYPVIKQGP
ncbi:hypothetical protein ACJZ2D_010346 [Fusarium nematophilum]